MLSSYCQVTEELTSFVKDAELLRKENSGLYVLVVVSYVCFGFG